MGVRVYREEDGGITIRVGNTFYPFYDDVWSPSELRKLVTGQKDFCTTGYCRSTIEEIQDREMVEITGKYLEEIV